MTAEPASPDSLRARPLLIAGYGIGLVLILLPVLETFAALWPPNPSNAGWRYAAIGIFFTFLSMAPLGLLVALSCATLLRHGLAVRALAVTSLLLAIVIAVLFGSFSLDFVQVRTLIQPRVKGGFDVAGVKATVTAILSLVSCMILALAGFRVSRDFATHARARPKLDPKRDMVVGVTGRAVGGSR